VGVGESVSLSVRYLWSEINIGFSALSVWEMGWIDCRLSWGVARGSVLLVVLF